MQWLAPSRNEVSNCAHEVAVLHSIADGGTLDLQSIAAALHPTGSLQIALAGQGSLLDPMAWLSTLEATLHLPSGPVGDGGGPQGNRQRA